MIELLIHFKFQKKHFGRYMTEINHPRTNSVLLAKIPQKVFETTCRTRKNGVDCGVFVMRNMEHYKGENEGEYKSKIQRESQVQKDTLNRMRYRYAYTLLMSELNLKKEELFTRAKLYAEKPIEERNQDKLEAASKMKQRLRETVL